MQTQQSVNATRIEQLSAFLKCEGYSAGSQRHYPSIARRFLAYLEDQNKSAEIAQIADVEGFLQKEDQVYRKRHSRAPGNIGAWRSEHAAPAQLLLRLVHGHWPPKLSPASQREEFHRSLLCGYDAWMRELRGLAVTTREGRCSDARRILDALGDRSDPDVLKDLKISDIDMYVHSRSTGMRRCSIKSMTGSLRIFLRYLYGIGAIAQNLSSSVTSPMMYAYEGIPSALRPEDVMNALAITRQDNTAAGIRDYAILQLLATYGLRAGEITGLRLNDIDWKKDILHVRHSKTGALSSLPLLPDVGESLISYLKKGRPPTALREVFLCLHAPYRAFKEGSSLYSTVRGRLEAASVTGPGKKGPHTFRHARAVSLLRAAVPLKAIGDILGHRSALSTGAYLKLATDDLRAVALDVPTVVSP